MCSRKCSRAPARLLPDRDGLAPGRGRGGRHRDRRRRRRLLSLRGHGGRRAGLARAMSSIGGSPAGLANGASAGTTLGRGSTIPACASSSRASSARQAVVLGTAGEFDRWVDPRARIVGGAIYGARSLVETVRSWRGWVRQKQRRSAPGDPVEMSRSPGAESQGKPASKLAFLRYFGANLAPRFAMLASPVLVLTRVLPSPSRGLFVLVVTTGEFLDFDHRHMDPPPPHADRSGPRFGRPGGPSVARAT